MLVEFDLEGVGVIGVVGEFDLEGVGVIGMDWGGWGG